MPGLLDFMPQQNMPQIGMPEPNWLQRGLNNPLTHIGLGLAQSFAPRYSTNVADLNNGGIAGGLLSGIGSYNAYQGQQQDRALKGGLLQAKQGKLTLEQQKLQAEIAEKKRAQAALMQLVATLPPAAQEQAAAMAQAGAEPEQIMAQFSPAPKQFAPPSDQAMAQWLLTASQEEREKYESMKEANAQRAAAAAASSPAGLLAQSMAGTQHQIALQTLADRQDKARDRQIDADAKARGQVSAAKDRQWKTKFVLEEAKGLVEDITAGNTGRLAKWFKQWDPQSSTAALQLKIGPVMANLVSDAIQDARKGSTTGATGYGALSEKELGVLQRQVADLENAQWAGSAEMKAAVKKIIRQYERLQEAVDQDLANIEADRQKRATGGLLGTGDTAPQGAVVPGMTGPTTTPGWTPPGVVRAR